MGSKWTGNAKRKNGGMLDRRDHRREQIAEMLLRGETYQTIGTAVGLSVNHVSREIADIRSQWHEQTKKHGDKIVSQLLQQLDLIKRESLREWERSKQPKVKIVKKYCELLDGPGVAPSAMGGIGGLPNVAGPLASGEGVGGGNDRGNVSSDETSGQDSRPIYPENPFANTDDWSLSGESSDESSYRNPFGDEPIDDEASEDSSSGDSISSGKSKKQKPGKSDNLLLAAEVTQTVEERLGDPRYLVVAQSCIEKQANMLGLNVSKVALTDPTGQQTYAAGAVQDLMVLAEEVAQGPIIFDDSIIELEASKYLIENSGVGGGGNGGAIGANGGESSRLASGEGNGGGGGEEWQGHDEGHDEGHDDDMSEIMSDSESGEALSFPLANQLSPIGQQVQPTTIAPTHSPPTKKPNSFSLFDSQPGTSQPDKTTE